MNRPNRPSLASSMKALKQEVAPDPVALVAKAREESEPSKFKAATREGMKRLLVPVTPELHKRLKQAALDADTTLETITRAALEAAFPSK